ncbi:MAG: EpsD family peptidyl-prolyl cis-trans isomerase, partial [Betaproteobacteria bacterium]
GPEIAAAEAPRAQALAQALARELLVQKALEAGLARDPAVAEAIDSARRQVLARAWLERLAAPARSTREEVRAFYAENPALFAGRRIYRLRELAVSAPAELVEPLRAAAAHASGLDDVAAWLRLRKVRFEVVNTVQPAEHLPLAVLPELARLKAGEIAVFAAPPGASVVQLLHAAEAPLSEAQAAPLIEQFLAGRQRLALAAAEVKKLREAASIQYVGDTRARAR